MELDWCGGFFMCYMLKHSRNLRFWFSVLTTYLNFLVLETLLINYNPCSIYRACQSLSTKAAISPQQTFLVGSINVSNQCLLVKRCIKKGVQNPVMGWASRIPQTVLWPNNFRIQYGCLQSWNIERIPNLLIVVKQTILWLTSKNLWLHSDFFGCLENMLIMTLQVGRPLCSISSDFCGWVLNVVVGLKTVLFRKNSD